MRNVYFFFSLFDTKAIKGYTMCKGNSFLGILTICHFLLDVKPVVFILPYLQLPELNNIPVVSNI